MNAFYPILEVLVAGAFLFSGIAALISKKPVGTNYDQYTPESLAKYSLPYGILNIIAGLGMVGYGIVDTFLRTPDDEMFLYRGIALGICAVAMLLLLPFRSKYLQKIGAPSSAASSEAQADNAAEDEDEDEDDR